MSTRRVVRQVAGPGAARSQWFATVLSGSTTLGWGQASSYGATAARCQHSGTPVRHRYSPSDATTPRRTID
jgi:hypothetical protein